jgi:hypothetical protein
MAGFPETGTHTEIGHSSKWLAGPGSLFPFEVHNKGPVRYLKMREYSFNPKTWVKRNT